jgi:putative SOS response-associated peptidase YedK
LGPWDSVSCREDGKKFGEDAVSVGEIFPTNTAPILTMEGNQLTPVPVFWGFPKWDGSKGVLINARSESALQKPLFSKPLLTRRCVIPSTGFYEWTYTKSFERQTSLFPIAEEPPSPKDPKVKLFFRRPGEVMLYMAGMIGTFTGADGNPCDAFCILTAEAKHSIARFHERMPVILSPDEREDWIGSDAFMREVLAREGPELEWKLAG